MQVTKRTRPRLKPFSTMSRLVRRSHKRLATAVLSTLIITPLFLAADETQSGQDHGPNPNTCLPPETIDPEQIAALEELIFEYINAERYDDALQCLETLLDTGLNDMGYSYFISEVSAKAGYCDRAEEALKTYQAERQRREGNLRLEAREDSVYPMEEELLFNVERCREEQANAGSE